MSWTRICRYDELLPERGVAALVDGVQVAVFRTHDGALYAVDHHDPFSGANIMARGIVGSRGDAPTVASPMYKQVFDLRTGICLDDPTGRLRVHRVRVEGGVVEVEAQLDAPLEIEMENQVEARFEAPLEAPFEARAEEVLA